MRLLLLEKPMQGLVRQLRTRELLPLGAAIFLLFSVLGPTTDLLAGARQPLFVLIGNTLFSGFLALGYALGSMRRSYPVLAISVAAQVLWIAGTRRLPGTVEMISQQIVAAARAHGTQIDDQTLLLIRRL